jgi:hypothetical protein
MNWLSIGLVSATMMLACALADAKSPPSPSYICPLPGTDSAAFLSLDPLPAPVKRALANQIGDGQAIDMVARDADFQETDLIESPDGPLSFHRLIQAGHSGSRWFVWFETGGPTSYGIIIEEWRPGDSEARLITSRDASSGDDLCLETLKHLNDSPAKTGG